MAGEYWCGVGFDQKYRIGNDTDTRIEVTRSVVGNCQDDAIRFAVAVGIDELSAIDIATRGGEVKARSIGSDFHDLGSKNTVSTAFDGQAQLHSSAVWIGIGKTVGVGTLVVVSIGSSTKVDDITGCAQALTGEILQYQTTACCTYRGHINVAKLDAALVVGDAITVGITGNQRAIAKVDPSVKTIFQSI